MLGLLGGVVGEVLSLYGTRSSEFWAAAPAKMDVLNLRRIFPSSSREGIPDLERCLWVPDRLGAWHLPRQRAGCAAGDGAIHFFLDDYRFETAFSSPERTLGRVTAVGGALTPDFSLWRDMPRAALVWNVYRSRWCGAFWQSHGVRVVPTVSWARPESFEFCFDGLPFGGVVALSSVGVRAEDAEGFRLGVRELIDRVGPATILCYGKFRYCDGLDLPAVREYPTFWDSRGSAVAG